MDRDASSMPATESAAPVPRDNSVVHGNPVPQDKPVTIDAPATADQPRAIRVWPGLLLAGAFWAFCVGIGQAGLPITTTFMSRAAAGALLTLLFPIWWLTNGTVRWADRLWMLLALVVGAATACVVAQKTLGVFGVLFFGLPVAFAVWAIGLLALRRFSPRHLRAGLILAISLTWGYFMLIRSDGISGDLKTDIRWRWSPRTEDAYLAERARASRAAGSAEGKAAHVGETTAVEPRPGDWPVYRGPQRNGEVRGLEIPTDWNAAPPQLVWKQRIGPAWSSMLVIDGRLFTQEQVGEAEAVACLDAATGRRIWSHEDQARFWDSQSGAGPRATPAFDGGRIYAQGATGILNCLDAATGELKWSRDIIKDSSAPLPMWGFSSTPLVSNGLAIVFTGGQGGKGLLAYRADDGELAWTAPTGSIGYTSPQPVEIGGAALALYLSDAGLTAVEPATGKVAWDYEAPGRGVWRAVQPAVVRADRVLIGSEDLGLVCLDVQRTDDAWSAKKHWASRSMKPGYNDFVIRDGSAYGFDGSIFCCVDLASGKRQWKGGRYGHGQVLLLADQGLLVVSCESGEAVLLEATPEAHRELGRFQAIEGKTWNHPAIAQGCLYLRNDEQIACYRLQAAADAPDADTAP